MSGAVTTEVNRGSNRRSSGASRLTLAPVDDCQAQVPEPIVELCVGTHVLEKDIEVALPADVALLDAGQLVVAAANALHVGR